MSWLKSRTREVTETIGATMEAMRLEALANERTWRVGEERRKRAAQNEAQRLDCKARDVPVIHPAQLLAGTFPGI